MVGVTGSIPVAPTKEEQQLRSDSNHRGIARSYAVPTQASAERFWDCGSRLAGRHTSTCDLAAPSEALDLPAKLRTKWLIADAADAELDPYEPLVLIQPLDDKLQPWAGYAPAPATIEYRRGQLHLTAVFAWHVDGPSPPFTIARVIGWRNGQDLFSKDDGSRARCHGSRSSLTVTIPLKCLP